MSTNDRPVGSVSTIRSTMTSAELELLVSAISKVSVSPAAYEDLFTVLDIDIVFADVGIFNHLAKMMGVDVKFVNESPTLPFTFDPPCWLADNGTNKVESPSPTTFHLNNTEIL